MKGEEAMARSKNVRRLDKAATGLRDAANAFAAMSRAVDNEEDNTASIVSDTVRSHVAGLKVEVDLAFVDMRQQLANLRDDVQGLMVKPKRTAKKTS